MSCVPHERLALAALSARCDSSIEAASPASCSYVPLSRRSRLASGAGLRSLKRTSSRFCTTRNCCARASRLSSSALIASRCSKCRSIRSKYSCRGRGSLKVTSTPGSARRSRSTSSCASSHSASKLADCRRYLPAFLERRMVTSGPHRYWKESAFDAVFAAASAERPGALITSSKSEGSAAGGWFVSSVTLKSAFFTGGITRQTSASGRANDVRAVRGSPSTVV
mmetsp:Transcript_6302/g.16103  ORF Transcript_6302/g.16103 Transcript_6302/m.16103 type:complete len:224 (+) Transcript_6302:501-1172(+)